MGLWAAAEVSPRSLRGREFLEIEVFQALMFYGILSFFLPLF